jgi:hypothetical protein
MLRNERDVSAERMQKDARFAEILGKPDVTKKAY